MMGVFCNSPDWLRLALSGSYSRNARLGMLILFRVGNADSSELKIQRCPRAVKPYFFFVNLKKINAQETRKEPEAKKII
jgi:hypothetical protein